MLQSNLLLGCDPEWFLTDGSQPVSAIGKFQGTKKRPFPLLEGVTCQVDNCAVEYGILPAQTLGQWLHMNIAAYDQISNMAMSMGLAVHIVPSVVFPDKELDTPEAWIFGCDPDFNAWDLAWNPKPKAKNPNLRSAGGHGHFGYKFTSKEQVIEAARAADMFIGVPGLLVDSDDRRRELYGKAGAMRFKKYGFEWRTGSNFWTVSINRLEWFYRQCHEVIAFVTKGGKVPKDVQQIIDNGDRDDARAFCQLHSIEETF